MWHDPDNSGTGEQEGSEPWIHQVSWETEKKSIGVFLFFFFFFSWAMEKVPLETVLILCSLQSSHLRALTPGMPHASPRQIPPCMVLLRRTRDSQENTPSSVTALAARIRNPLIQKLLFNLSARQLNSIPKKGKRRHDWDLIWLYNSSLWSEIRGWKIFTSLCLKLGLQVKSTEWAETPNNQSLILSTKGAMPLWEPWLYEPQKIPIVQNLYNSNHPTNPPSHHHPLSPSLRNWFTRVSGCRSFRFKENMSSSWF